MENFQPYSQPLNMADDRQFDLYDYCEQVQLEELAEYEIYNLLRELEA